ncbi:MAG TPA: hypothetical protein VGL29_02095 [Blastocatellia bacterium]|jgi:hypothetical protein
MKTYMRFSRFLVTVVLAVSIIAAITLISNGQVRLPAATSAAVSADYNQNTSAADTAAPGKTFYMDEFESLRRESGKVALQPPSILDCRGASGD